MDIKTWGPVPKLPCKIWCYYISSSCTRIPKLFFLSSLDQPIHAVSSLPLKRIFLSVKSSKLDQLLQVLFIVVTVVLLYRFPHRQLIQIQFHIRVSKISSIFALVWNGVWWFDHTELQKHDSYGANLGNICLCCTDFHKTFCQTDIRFVHPLVGGTKDSWVKNVCHCLRRTQRGFYGNAGQLPPYRSWQTFWEYIPRNISPLTAPWKCSWIQHSAIPLPISHLDVGKLFKPRVFHIISCHTTNHFFFEKSGT